MLKCFSSANDRRCKIVVRCVRCFAILTSKTNNKNIEQIQPKMKILLNFHSLSTLALLLAGISIYMTIALSYHPRIYSANKWVQYVIFIGLGVVIVCCISAINIENDNDVSKSSFKKAKLQRAQTLLRFAVWVFLVVIPFTMICMYVQKQKQK